MVSNQGKNAPGLTKWIAPQIIKTIIYYYINIWEIISIKNVASFQYYFSWTIPNIVKLLTLGNRYPNGLNTKNPSNGASV